MRPIWFFVGLLLSVMGAIILLNGLYLFFSSSGQGTVLGSLHPDVWWGAFMTVAGLLFLLLNRKTTVQ